MIQAVEIVFLTMLLFVVLFAALARKLQTPYPIVLVVAGLLLSFIPGMPKVELNPDVVVLVGLTVIGVAETARWVFPNFTLTVGFVLGAVVATTDAIAATSIAKRVGLP